MTEAEKLLLLIVLKMARSHCYYDTGVHGTMPFDPNSMPAAKLDEFIATLSKEVGEQADG